MKNGIDLSTIYNFRNSFNIIGLTGRIGSGCTDVAELLKNGFKEDIYDLPNKTPEHNTDRKYSIVYKFAKENFHPYFVIEYKHILSLFIFKESFFSIKSNIKHLYFTKFEIELEDEKFNEFQEKYERISDEFEKFDLFDIDIKDYQLLFNFFISSNFLDASTSLNKLLCEISHSFRLQFLHDVSNNLRKSGCVFCETNSENFTVYCVVELINIIIKGHKKNSDKCNVVIDSLRNPLEILYFREKYAGFYMISVNRNESEIRKELDIRFNENNKLIKEIEEIDIKEYKGGSDTEFYKQNISECIQKSDIHLSNISKKNIEEFNNVNREKNNNTSPKFTLQQQLLKYISCMFQPGIITPSPEERMMQIAYTAKYNSGCISRQVGAVITDENYSIKAIGWNNTPEGQVPCLLRNSDELVSENGDQSAFSPYEIDKHGRFKAEFNKYYYEYDKTKLKGRNVSYCFKCIQNSFTEGKNQVHTRSLHAEESAFLQITKYGGQGVKNGKLFTTASPCELCSKKAYQLGIEVIYYIDPYPGIATKHILESGKTPKELRLFHGAIGTAYHKLYSPFMAYKDELSLITGIEIKDLITKMRDELELYKKHIGSIDEFIQKSKE